MYKGKGSDQANHEYWALAARPELDQYDGVGHVLEHCIEVHPQLNAVQIESHDVGCQTKDRVQIHVRGVAMGYVSLFYCAIRAGADEARRPR